MKIEISEKAHRTLAFAIIAEGWNELVQTGLTPDGLGVCPVTRDDTVVYASVDSGEVVGVLVLASDWTAAEQVCRITLAYVEPSVRKKGVFKALLAAALAYAKSKGVPKVTISASPEADVLRLVMRKFDVPIAHVTYELAV